MSRPSLPTFNHEGGVADTAFVAAGMRARETERGTPLFLDPLASVLAGDHGRRVAGKLHSRLFFHGVTARTAVLDEFIAQTVNRDGARSVVNLGAGLDSRPYRLSLPADLRWVEVDLPRIVAYKSMVLNRVRPRCQLERLSVDLTDPAARQVLLDRLCGSGPTLILSERLVTDLRENGVVELARHLATGSRVEWWALDLPGSLWLLAWANWFPRRRSSGATTSLQFGPRGGAGFFRPSGWKPVDIRFSWLEQRRLGCEPRLMRAAWAASPRQLRQCLQKDESVRPSQTRGVKMICPQCGAETPDDEWNCVSCRMNLYWATRHYTGLAEIRDKQGLPEGTSSPPFLVQAHKEAMDDRADRGGRVVHRVRRVARKVMRKQS